VVVARSETRALSRVVKQLPVEKAPAVLECEQLYVDAHCHGGTLHLMSAFLAFYCEFPYAVFLVFFSAHVTLLWPLVAWILTISTSFLSQKRVPIKFVVGRRLFKLFRLVW
jgi:hypothetical protein